jgi:hypothetical protein
MDYVLYKEIPIKIKIAINIIVRLKCTEPYTYFALSLSSLLSSIIIASETIDKNMYTKSEIKKIANPVGEYSLTLKYDKKLII